MSLSLFPLLYTNVQNISIKFDGINASDAIIRQLLFVWGTNLLI